MQESPASASPVALPPAMLDWGRTRYADALARQDELVRQRIAAEIPDTLVFTEHEPVFTIGMRSGADAHLVWSADQLAYAGVELARTNRGGDITYHGPGQIVGYPIVSLAARRDLHAYLRFLEHVLINTLENFGVPAERRAGKTGIWTGHRKIAAIGIAVRRWVAYHGFALNVNPDLEHFAGIIPCGITPAEGTVTSMRKELRHGLDMVEVKDVIAKEFGELLPRFLTER